MQRPVSTARSMALRRLCLASHPAEDQLRKSLSLAGQPSREESRRAGAALLRICIEHIYAQTYLTILQMMQVNHTCVKSDFAPRLLLVGDETNRGREASALMLLEGTTVALPTSYSDFLLMENTNDMVACVYEIYMCWLAEGTGLGCRLWRGALTFLG